MTYRSVLARLLLTFFTIGVLTACDKPGNETPKAKPNTVTPDKPTHSTGSTPLTTPKNTDENSPRKKIETAIVHGLSLLDKKDMQTFVKTYMPPEFLERIMKNSTVEKFAKSITKERKILFHKSLTAAKNIKPVYNKARNRATIKLKAPARPLSFIKVGDYWYIR